MAIFIRYESDNLSFHKIEQKAKLWRNLWTFRRLNT